MRDQTSEHSATESNAPTVVDSPILVDDPDDSIAPEALVGWPHEANLAYLAAQDVRVAASLLYQAYKHDPVFLEIFDGPKEGYEQRLRAAIREELTNFWQAEQPMVGLYNGPTLEGVVCLSRMKHGEDSGRYWHWRLKMLLTAGYVSTRQMLEKERNVAQAVPYSDYLMISFMAVHPRYQHKGLGQLLLRAVNAVLDDYPAAEGVVALATRPEYEVFLQRQGFVAISTIQVGSIQGTLMCLARNT